MEDFVFKHVEQFNGTNIIQISGIDTHILALTGEGKVYSKGQNLFGQLGQGDRNDCLKKFVEISALNQYKIKAVSASESNSLFLTIDGKVLIWEYTDSINELTRNESAYFPVETILQREVEYCFSSNYSLTACIGFDPEK